MFYYIDHDKYILPNMYHGTAEHITAFDPDYTGYGEDQFGSGFYFDSNQYHAQQYARFAKNYQHRGNTPNVICATIMLKNPIIIRASDISLAVISVTNQQALNILKQISCFQSSDICENPISNYVSVQKTNNPETWLKAYTKQFHTTDLFELQILSQSCPTEFRQAVCNTLGYDGVIILYPNAIQCVAWFPEQIEIKYHYHIS